MDTPQTDSALQQKKVRWRLMLGSIEEPDQRFSVALDKNALDLDRTLDMLYDRTEGEGSMGGSSKKRGASKDKSSIKLSKWLGDVRRLFPSEVVQVIQADAIERKGLTQLFLEPENLEKAIPDIQLASLLLSLKELIPEESKQTARYVVRKVVEEIMQRLEMTIHRALRGALSKHQHSPIPHVPSLDWKRTIARNLKHYDPETKRLLPEKFYFFERQQKNHAWRIILDIDQSGSMSESILYASVMAAIFASMPALDTRVVAFDTSVVDLSEMCRHDPVDLLFGIQLGGGTDINQSVEYCQSLIEEPSKTIFILISDLEEGGVEAGLLRRLEAMKVSGVKVLTLLALSDEGRPAYDEVLGKKIAKLGIPCFACTPDRLPEVIAAAMRGEDLMHFTQTTSNR